MGIGNVHPLGQGKAEAGLCPVQGSGLLECRAHGYSTHPSHPHRNSGQLPLAASPVFLWELSFSEGKMEALNSALLQCSCLHTLSDSRFLSISLVPGIILYTEEARGEQNTQRPSVPKGFILVLKPGLNEVDIVNYSGGRGV